MAKISKKIVIKDYRNACWSTNLQILLKEGEGYCVQAN